MKNIIILIIIAAIIPLTFYGCMRCQNKTVVTSPFVESFLDNYNYELTDSSGTKLAEGTLRTRVYTEPDFKGTYTAAKLNGDNALTILPLEGKLTGTLDEKNKKAFINMNPGIADDNVFLRFKVSEDGLVGTWERSGMMGIKGKGLFKAVKMK
jgi:hypothetical protein